MQNPFTHTFGHEPGQYISTVQTEEIIENFSYPDPSEKCYMITGVRGCGKTVMLSKVVEGISKDESWVVVDLNVAGDMLMQLAAKLAQYPAVQSCFVKGKVNISVAGIGLGIELNKEKIYDVHVLIERMIGILAKKKKRVLITLDDVAATNEMRIFAHAFQGLLRAGLPVHIIMTGLLVNFREVTEKEEFKDCTFLLRAFQVQVQPLDCSQIAVSYLNIFDISEKEAIRLAKLTKGYAFAFQVLGWLVFEKNTKGKIKNLEFEYTSELIKYSYSKIWSELSELEMIIIKAMVQLNADEKKVKREEIIGVVNTEKKISSSTFNTYRERLIGKGIITVSENRDGFYRIELPQFGVFVRDYHSDTE